MKRDKRTCIHTMSLGHDQRWVQDLATSQRTKSERVSNISSPSENTIRYLKAEVTIFYLYPSKKMLTRLNFQPPKQTHPLNSTHETKNRKIKAKQEKVLQIQTEQAKTSNCPIYSVIHDLLGHLLKFRWRATTDCKMGKVQEM